MPSTYTTRNRAELQAPGENNNSWGTILNTNTLALLDAAADGMVSFALSTTKTLSTANGAADEARMRFINITSGTGGTVTIPNLEKWYLVRNATSGNVIFTTGSGTTATIKAGNVEPIVSTGANVVYAAEVTAYGALSAAGLLSTTAGQLNTGTIITRFENQEVNPPAGAAGRGLEIIGQHSNGFSYLQCYNRTTAASAPLIIEASATSMRVGGATIATASAAGLAVDLLFSTAAGQLNTGAVSTRWQNTESGVPAGASGRGIEIIGSHTNGFSYIECYNRSNSTYASMFINALQVKFGQITTTASAANAFLDGSDNNNLLRSTSARRYKTDITDVAPDDARAILEKLRPILYRSAALHDDPDKQYYGLIAEEVAEVCPDLVHWVDGEPDGVMYDRLPVLLIAAMHARPA